MFISLFLKECKLILKSITYYVLIICIIGFMLGQLESFDLRKPEPSDKNFGYIISNDKTQIMKEATENLKIQYQENKYNTYPFGFVSFGGL
ncbi:MAG: hypothetical protein E7214_15785 [Clostridium sp.]|nr:hypothetical protein [Clostridium sp.]